MIKIFCNFFDKMTQKTFKNMICLDLCDLSHAVIGGGITNLFWMGRGDRVKECAFTVTLYVGEVEHCEGTVVPGTSFCKRHRVPIMTESDDEFKGCWSIDRNQVRCEKERCSESMYCYVHQLKWNTEYCAYEKCHQQRVPISPYCKEHENFSEIYAWKNRNIVGSSMEQLD